jgi:hypothetical protein
MNETGVEVKERAEAATGRDTLAPARVRAPGTGGALQGAVVGVLVGFRDDGRVPLVLYPGQPGSAAVAACATLDLHGSHIGRQVVLVFEDADPARPIILGCMQRPDSRSVLAPAEVAEIDADGERLIVSAKEQLVLRCGKASVTLTKAGKILITGTYISSRSSGVLRVKGGSVQIN